MRVEGLIIRSFQSTYRYARSSLIAFVSVALALGFLFAALVTVDTMYAAFHRASEETSGSLVHDGVRAMSWNNPGKFEDSLFMIAMSLPSVAIGLLVAVAGSNLAVSMRKSEVHALKTNGCSKHEIRFVLFLDSVLVGAIAGIVTLIVAWAVAKAAFGTLLVMVTRYDDSLVITAGDLTLSANTALTAVLLAIGLMVVAWARPSGRLVAMFFEERSAKTARRSSSGLGPLLDVVLIALSLASVIDILYGMRWSGSHGFDWYTGSVSDMIGAAGLLLFPAMPLMLTVGIGRILTRKPIMLHKRLGRIMLSSERAPGAIEEDPVDRRRAARACILVALALAFGTFASVAMQSNIEHQRATVRHEIGADIAVDFSYYQYYDGASWNPQLDPSLLGNIGLINGVGSSTLITHFVPFLGQDYVAAVAMDPESYARTVRPSDDYFGEQGSSELVLLNQNRAALISERYAGLHHNILNGSEIDLKVMTGSFDYPLQSWLNVTVAGTVKDLPGMIYADVYIGYVTTEGMISQANLTMISNGMTAIIDLAEGADSQAVASAASSIINQAGLETYGVSTLEDRYEWIDVNWGYGTLSDFVVGEYVYVLLVAVVLVSMVSYVSVVQSRSRASLGDEPSTDHRAVKVESVVLVALGAAIGTVIALITAYLFFIVWEPTEDEAIHREVVYTSTTVILIVASFVSLLVAPLIGARAAQNAKLDVPLQPRGWL